MERRDKVLEALEAIKGGLQEGFEDELLETQVMNELGQIFNLYTLGDKVYAPLEKEAETYYTTKDIKNYDLYHSQWEPPHSLLNEGSPDNKGEPISDGSFNYGALSYSYQSDEHRGAKYSVEIEEDAQEEKAPLQSLGGFKYFNMNKELMKIIRTVQDDDGHCAIDYKSMDVTHLEHFLKMINQFHITADIYAKMIVAEKHLPFQDKKIQPVEGMGIAGGTKFKVHDLFFKFPEDKQVGTAKWIYGGWRRNDRIAGKATNHEIKGMAHLMLADVEKRFNYPMMVLIDYQGLRQTVLTEIPISKETLIYGSNDGGVTVKDDGVLHSYLKGGEVYRRLNLKEHKINGNDKELILCADIEIHKIQDEENVTNEHYVLDYARVLPPTNPMDYEHSIFFRLMRPEILKQVPFPVSSDSYSAFQSRDESPLLNKVAEDAYKYLLDTIKHIFSQKEETEKFLLDEDISYVMEHKPQFSSIQPKDYFTRKLHSQGINIRFLGLIVLHLHKSMNQYDDVEKIQRKIIFLFCLMGIRALKNLWRDNIQEYQQKHRNIHDSCFQISLKYLNDIHQNNIWKYQNVYHMMEEMFVRGILTREEGRLFFELFSQYQQFIDPFFVSIRFSQICGIELSDSTVSSLLRKNEVYFTQANIRNFNSIIKSPPVISYLTALFFVASAKQSKVISTKIEYYTQAILHIEYTLGYQFKSNHFTKLHNFVSFEILKYNTTHAVHWTNILDTLKQHKSEFEEFCGITSEIVELWTFLQSSLGNHLNHPAQLETSGILKLLCQNQLSNFGTMFMKQCAEYCFEKEQYFAQKRKQTFEFENTKIKWNELLNSSVENFLNETQSESYPIFDIEDIQYWDIDYQKKYLFLFFNGISMYHLANTNKDNLRLSDKITKNSLLGDYPLVKALVFEFWMIYMKLPQNTNFLSFQKQYLHDLFAIYQQNNMKDKLFDNMISYYKLYDISSISLLLILQDIEEIIKSSSNISTWVRTYSPLTSINIIDSSIRDVDVCALIECLSKNTTVTALNLKENEIGDMGAKEIFEFLKSNTFIADVNLDSNSLRTKGAQYVSECLKVNTTITSLNIGSNRLNNNGAHYIFEGLAYNSTITDLNIESNDISNKGAEEIAQFILKNSTLKTLNIAVNKIGGAGAVAISEALKLNETITSFNIGYNELGDAGIIAISHCLKQNTTLTFIDLECCEFEKEGVDAISDCLKFNTTLTKINLRINSLTNDSLKTICEGLQFNTRLTSILLKDNLINNDGVSTIIQCLKTNTSIKEMEIQNNKIGIEELKAIQNLLNKNT